MGADWSPDCWKSREWRLNHLYWIERKAPLPPCRFRLNWAQAELFHNLWYRNNILKVRQLGISTFIALLILDNLLSNENWHAGINDKTIPDAEEKMAKIKFAYDSLTSPPTNGEDFISDPDDLDNIAKYSRALAQTARATFVARSATFANHNSVRVGVNLRGGTLHFLHISEFGAVAANNPKKALGILRGSTNTVPEKGLIVMESTHEGGPFGENYRLTREAMNNAGHKDLTPLQFRFFFFPWWKHPDYKLDSPAPLSLSKEQADYFRDLEQNHHIALSVSQKRWYISQWLTQGVGVFQEYPSIPEEAWHSKVEGAIYGYSISELRSQGYLNCNFEPIDDSPLYVSWDIGLSDCTALWIMQPGPDGRFYLLDCHSANNQPISHYISVIRNWEAFFGQSIFRHFLPHDASKRDPTLRSYTDLLIPQGIHPIVLPRTTDIWLDIDTTRRFLRHCVFHLRCNQPTRLNGTEYMSGLAALESYRTAPIGVNGVIREMPIHDSSSHLADSFRYMAIANSRHLISPHTIPLSPPHTFSPSRGLRSGIARGTPWATPKK